ncbi:MAG TPA: hypothetical protein VJT82_01490 [Pyrinomonadaceae bacterium]|nr:hypothetical protein [Pyrinomonadaceae bacterium]
MNPSTATPPTGVPDFGATVTEPPRQSARPYATPAVANAQPPLREPVYASPTPSPYGVAHPMQPGAQPVAGHKKKSRVKSAILFVLLLLFLMGVAFVLALLID